MTYSIKDRLGGRWISGLHTQTRPLIWLRGRWTLVVDVHIIFLAGQSSPILAVHNGAAGDTRCFPLLHSERQGHPDRLNWIDLSLFGLCSAGLPFGKNASKRDENTRKKLDKGYRGNLFLQKHIRSGATVTLRSLFWNAFKLQHKHAVIEDWAPWSSGGLIMSVSSLLYYLLYLVLLFLVRVWSTTKR